MRNATCVDASDFTKKVHLVTLKSNVHKLDIDRLEKVPKDLSSLKSKVDKLDIGKLKTAPVDLRKLSDVVKNDVVKTTEYDELIKKVNATDIGGLVRKTDYNAKIKDIKDQIPDITNLATVAALNAKVKKVKGEIFSITGLATTTALTAVENKIKKISSLVKKANYDKKKIGKIEKKLIHAHGNKHITTQ